MSKKSFIFGMPRIGLTIVLGIEGFSVFALYTIGYNLSPFLAGFAISIGYISIALFSFLFGWISDIKYTKWGRRKPYIIIFAPLIGISFIFLMLPSLLLPDLNNKVDLFIWLLIWEIIFKASYGVTTPYQAWLAEQFDIDERPRVSQIQSIFNLLGTSTYWIFSFLVLTQVFDLISSTPNILPYYFALPIFLFGIITVALFYINAFFMPIEPKVEIKSTLLNILKVSIKNKNFMAINLMIAFSSMAWVIILAQILPFYELVLNMDLSGYLLIMITEFVCIILFLDIWRRIIKKYGKKQTVLYIFILAVLILPTTLLGLIQTNNYLLFGLLFMIGIGAPLGGWYLLPAVIFADLAEYDEKTTGELKAGTYMGLPSIFLNIFQAIGVFLLGIINELPDIEVGSSSFSMGLILWGPFCSLILIISWWYTRKYLILDYR
ncbi:MAG: MFS transporter [Candidatus Hermodarchaeota archaeon]